MTDRLVKRVLAGCIICLGTFSVAMAETLVVTQKDKQFSPQELTIGVGDTVEFLNEDPLHHNIFSLSDLKMFDLGSFPQGESRSVTFNEAGSLTVECAVHPQMEMKIHVKE